MRKFLWRNEEETMELIVAVSEDWGIGKDGNLLFSIPEDMKFFRQTTQGKTVVMGRKTLESLPGGKPLKNRQNIVLQGCGIAGSKPGDGNWRSGNLSTDAFLVRSGLCDPCVCTGSCG